MDFRTVLRYFLIGLLVGIIGFYLLQILASSFKLDYASNILLVCIPFLTVVIITCTGIIVSHLEKK